MDSWLWGKSKSHPRPQPAGLKSENPDGVPLLSSSHASLDETVGEKLSHTSRDVHTAWSDLRRRPSLKIGSFCIKLNSRIRLLLLPLPFFVICFIGTIYWGHKWWDPSSSRTGLRIVDGIAYVSDEPSRGWHPIEELIEIGRRKAVDMEVLRREVSDLNSAVTNYKKAFGMNPPEGFDTWFEFAQDHNSTSVPSLIPFAHTSVTPYLSLPADSLQSRAISMQDGTGIFGMTFHPTLNKLVYSNEDGMTGYMSPPGDYRLLLEPILSLLPPNQQEDRPVQISACVKDGSCRLVKGSIMEKSREMAKRGEVWDVQELEELERSGREPRGWMQTCPNTPRSDSKPSSGKSFVADLLDSMDFCKHPQLIDINGEMIIKKDHIMRPLAPILAVSRLSHGADMMGVPTRSVNNTQDYIPWAEKSLDKAVWRGTITGVFHRQRWDWRNNQRYRLSRLAMDKTNQTQIDVLGYGGSKRRFGLGGMVSRWLDVGVVDRDLEAICGMGPTGEACRIDGDQELEKHHLCEGYDSACEEMKSEIAFVDGMSNAEALPFKYRLDIDGYGWSSRFHKVMASGTVIMKSTVYPEWWTEQIIPWYHLVPIKYDFTDIWDIMAFFTGTPDSHETDNGRDDLAKEIAAEGRKFALERLRWVDMQSYMLLFLLEYRRAWSFDRDAASWEGSMVLPL